MNPANRFAKLLEPGKIGSVKTRNRIIKTGAGTFMWHQDELHMNEPIKAFYEAFARGGVGLLIVESPTIVIRSAHAGNSATELMMINIFQG